MTPELVTCIECGNEQTHRVCAACFASSLTVEPAKCEHEPVIDLMAALRKSVEDAKERRLASGGLA